MYFKKNTRIELLTPDLAKEVAAMRGLPGERELRAARVRFLRNHLKDGSFVGPSWAIAVDESTGETFRINGQHSSNMLAALEPEDFPAGLNVTIDTYGFSDMAQDVSGLFNLFDHPRSARTDTDYMGITRARYPEFSDLDNGYLMKVAAGVDVNIRMRTARSDAANVQEELQPHRDHGNYFINEEYRNFALWLHQWRETTHFAFIGRNGVTSEILDDWRSAPEFAAEFWGWVFRENHPDPEHESRELVRELQALSMKPKKVPADEWQKKTRKYWHRYFRFRRSQEQHEETVAEATADETVMPFMVPEGQSIELHSQM